ncbi:hypothetical protein FT641_18085 [Bacillus paranthracis]|uniref:hypothetical protein n=1 Tax=Bacillus paranthracis TaxID=2026186 RepID=UPI001879C183|nr:hypothetical protein [Bacillus paranthracis]MBE7114528.1 hypothetical protein [Bacillus paranthracis]MBE7154598.1 hypothetical protein [Bacillus paranthracis]
MVNSLKFGCKVEDGWSRLAQLKNLMNVDGQVALRYAKVFESLGREINRDSRGLRIYSDEEVQSILKLRECERRGENILVAAERILKELKGETVLVDMEYSRYSRLTVAERLGTSVHTVANHTKTLEKKGYKFTLVNGRNRVYSEKDINIIQKMMTYNDEGMRLVDAAEKVVAELNEVMAVKDEGEKTYRLRVVADMLGYDKDDILRYMIALERGGYTVARNEQGIRLYTAETIEAVRKLRELKDSGVRTGKAVNLILNDNKRCS